MEVEFKDRKETRKGATGERLVKNYFAENGYITYSPDSEDLAHAFDTIVVSNDKQKMFIVEIKTKARLNKYNATGINTRNLEEYLYLNEKYGMLIYLIFVDEMLGTIYGGELGTLTAPYFDGVLQYPNTEIINRVTIFSLDKMFHIRDLSEFEIIELKGFTTRTHEYELN